MHTLKPKYEEKPHGKVSPNGSRVVLDKNQSKQLQNKYQQQLQQLKKKQERKQDESYLSDDGGHNTSKKELTPKNKSIRSHLSSNSVIPSRPQTTQTREQHHARIFSQNLPQGFTGETQEDELIDPEEERVFAEETLLNGHLDCVKEEAQLITQEGEWITRIENAMVSQTKYDMKGYVQMTEKIAKKKLEMYSKLLEELNEFKSKYAEEF